MAISQEKKSPKLLNQKSDKTCKSECDGYSLKNWLSVGFWRILLLQYDMQVCGD